MNVKAFVGRTMMTVEDNLYEVRLYNPNIKLQKGYGYIKGDYVYVYRGKEKIDASSPMGIYKSRLDEKYVIVDGDEKEKRDFSVDNVVELDLDAMLSYVNSNKEDFTTPKDVEVINNSSTVFAPPINITEDDFLKLVVKMALGLKKINLKNYKDKFELAHTLPNIKSALVSSTKTSVPVFMQWAELLGFAWTLKIYDDGTDSCAPLSKEIIYDSIEGLRVEDKK